MYLVSNAAYRFLRKAAKAGKLVSEILIDLTDESKYSLTSGEVAEMSGLHPSRIKQIGRELIKDGDRFVIRVGRNFKFRKTVVAHLSKRPETRGRKPAKPKRG